MNCLFCNKECIPFDVESLIGYPHYSTDDECSSCKICFEEGNDIVIIYDAYDVHDMPVSEIYYSKKNNYWYFYNHKSDSRTYLNINGNIKLIDIFIKINKYINIT